MTNLLNLFWATRPAFLLITILGCLLDLLVPQSLLIPWHLNALSILVAVTAHAGANLFNDYFDHINGGDATIQSTSAPLLEEADSFKMKR